MLVVFLQLVFTVFSMNVSSFLLSVVECMRTNLTSTVTTEAEAEGEEEEEVEVV